MLTQRGVTGACLTLFAYSMFLYSVTSVMNLPVISTRLYELLNVVVLICLPNLFACNRFGSRWAGGVFVVIVMYGLVNGYYLVMEANIYPELTGAYIIS